ncbi:MAG: hypothetical protein ACK5MV_04910 [Aminipila sp.]
MLGLLIFLISILLIGICFLVAISSYGNASLPIKKGSSVPDIVQSAFREFADELLAGENILLEDAKLLKLEPLSEIPFENGIFQYFRAEYVITPESPVENAHGMVLNSREIFAKAGLNDQLVVLYFKEDDDIFEIDFMPEKRINLQGFKAHIEARYRNVKEYFPLEEYTFILEDKKFALWDNLKGEKPLEQATVLRSKADGHLGYTARYVDTFETEDLDIYSWVRFERKNEIIYKMTAKTYKVQTSRGINVGDTIDELKSKYPINLAYLENFEDEGPAYGYIPEDDTFRYIAFKVEEGLIKEIVITEGFEKRPFVPKDGYVDQDIPWKQVDYSNKLTDKYARSLYLGRHKADLDSRQVFNSFVVNNFNFAEVIEKGLWRDLQQDKEQIYFIIQKIEKEEIRVYTEVKLKQLTINTFSKDTVIWVVTHYRSQKKRG